MQTFQSSVSPACIICFPIKPGFLSSDTLLKKCKTQDRLAISFVLQSSCNMTDITPRYENIKHLVAELMELNCTSYTIYRNLYCTELAFSQEPREFTCLMTNDSERTSNYFLQAAFIILLVHTFQENNTDIEAHDDEFHKDLEFLPLSNS